MTDLSGQWNVEIKYEAGASTHKLHLTQQGNTLQGTHQGDFDSREVSGRIDGDAITLASRITERTGNSLDYRFTGTAIGDQLSGTLDMGEYRQATWTARRHEYARPFGSA